MMDDGRQNVSIIWFGKELKQKPKNEENPKESCAFNIGIGHRIISVSYHIVSPGGYLMGIRIKRLPVPRRSTQHEKPSLAQKKTKRKKAQSRILSPTFLAFSLTRSPGSRPSARVDIFRLFQSRPNKGSKQTNECRKMHPTRIPTRPNKTLNARSALPCFCVRSASLFAFLLQCTHPTPKLTSLPHLSSSHSFVFNPFAFPKMNRIE